MSTDDRAENEGGDRASEGGAGGSVGTHEQEIAQHRHAVEVLEHRERQLSTILRTSRDGFWLLDLQGRLLEVNEAASTMLGYTREELLHLTIQDIEAAETPADSAAHIEKIRREGSDRFDTRFRRKNSAIIDVEISVSFMDLAGGRLVAFLRDITERKAAEAALRASEERFRTVVESGPDGIFVAVEARFAYLNRTAVRLFGAGSASELLGRSIAERYHPEDLPALRQRAKQILEDRQPTALSQARYIRLDGSVFDADVVAVPFVYEGKNGGLVFFHDITGRKHLEDQLRQSQKMESIGQLAGGIAHDFNNVLAASLMQMELLQMDSNLDEETRESLRDLMSELHRAASLTRQLLLFSRKTVIQIQTLNLNDVVENLLKMLRRLIGEDIRLEWQAASGLWPVRVDAGMMEQVVMNLVVNSRDAMPKGGDIRIATQTVQLGEEQARTNAQARPGCFVCLSVTDTGSGIDPAILPRVFEPFFTSKPAGKGTGLGLATVYGIVQQHTGWVTVESQVGKGTTFRVFLPAASLSPVSDKANSTTETPLGGRETILLVEDDRAVRRTTASYLRRLGYEVWEASNGVEALELWRGRSKRPDLLFTDMVMPAGLSGVELTEELRREDPTLKVILSSGYSPELARHTGPIPVDVTSLPKPCAPVEMARVVRRCLDSSTPRP